METINPYQKSQRHKKKISLGVRKNWEKRHNWTNTGKQEPTTREKAARKRIYGSE